MPRKFWITPDGRIWTHAEIESIDGPPDLYLVSGGDVANLFFNTAWARSMVNKFDAWKSEPFNKEVVLKHNFFYFGCGDPGCGYYAWYVNNRRFGQILTTLSATECPAPNGWEELA